MKFNILGVKGNSARVKTGIITFDVLVIDVCGNLRIKIPDYIYIADRNDFNNLVGAVLAEYNNSLGDNNTNEKNKESSYV